MPDIDIAIKISEELYNKIKENDYGMYNGRLYQMIRDGALLPKEPKTGHWIDGHCSECGCDVPSYIVDWKWQKYMDAKYCPNCGTKMERKG